MLKADGHAVKEAHDGKQGVDMAAVEKFDLILMDMSGPVLEGAAPRVRSGKATARHQGPAMQSGRDDFLKHRMDDILTKPLKNPTF